MLKRCACPHPIPYVAPHKADSCVRCGHYIDPEWTCNSRTVDAWLDRLEDSLPGEDIEAFREHVVVRELAGRDRFGHSFLGKENLAEAKEEAVDLALYALLDTLKAERMGRGEEDIDLALTVAYHAFNAWKACDLLQHKRSGAP